MHARNLFGRGGPRREGTAPFDQTCGVERMGHRAQAIRSLRMTWRRFVLEEDFTNAKRGSQLVSF
jgi:hypothetical protein